MIRWLLVALVLSSIPTTAARQDSLAAARELYVTAGYDEALAMLDRLKSAEPQGPDARGLEQYRAYCLFALGRTADAEAAVERAVSLDPTWELADAEAPPRLVTFFSGVRTRVLASVLRERLDAAKKLHTDKKYEAAAEGFTGLLQLLDHPSIVRVASRDLNDLKTVASGFRDLAVAARDQEIKAEEREKALAAREKELAKAEAEKPAAAEPSATDPPGMITTGRAAGNASTEPVVPPVALNQTVPRPTDLILPLGSRAIIILDVLIDEFGRVERSSVRQSVNRAYEQQLLAAVKGWRYTPATQGGKTVKYVKTLEIELTPR